MTVQPPGLTPTGQRLFDLLPLVHRLRDADQGNVLRELLEVLGAQVDVLSEEISQLYEDQFIETCARWVAPYIGDLIGYRVLHGVVPQVASPRPEVANTIAYRRRKGTAAVLEQLAHDVTGWPARAVEFFERVVTTQYMNHPRPSAQATVDLRNHEALTWVGRQDAAFDDFLHTGDVRRINAGPASRGRHNVMNVGIFLWRTQAVPVARSPLMEQADGRRFRFDALGADEPLFGLPRTEQEISHLAEPLDVPLPLGRRFLGDHVGAYYGAGRSLLLERQQGAADPTPIPVADVRICDLSDVPGGTDWAHPPPAGKVAIDPVLGRVFLGTPVAAGERVLGTSCLGMAVPVGAGSATRQGLASPAPPVTATGGQGLQPLLTSIAAGGTLQINDSDRYPGDLTITTSTAPVGTPDTEVRLLAAERTRPSIVAAAVTLTLAPRTTVVLDGLLISGGPLVLDEVGDAETRTVILRNCTLVPGHTRTPSGQPAQPARASLIVLDPFARVVIERCVLGPVVAVQGSRVELTDSAVDASVREAPAIAGRPQVPGGLRTVSGVADMAVGDGTTAAGQVDLHECTVIGGIRCTQLDASNSLIVASRPPGDPRKAAVHASRRQVGCLRYSFLPEGSRTGRKYRCVPRPDDPSAVRRATTPRFTSLRYGDPAYLQLARTTTDAVRTGADDESEMGVTHLLFSPQRESNLLLRMDEYLRFGLEAGVFFAT